MMNKLNGTLTCCIFAFITQSSFAEVPEIKCKDYDKKEFTVKPKTITIYNNSESIIYPVIATSTNKTNEWIQGCLRTIEPHPSDLVYKLYVNENKGILPQTSVTITLPLYSKLSDNQYITWWNGGRVVLADGPDRLLSDKEDTALSKTPGGVSCTGQNTDCGLTYYSSKVQFPENVYAQLSEYTFGDSIIPVGQDTRLLKPENVGYNISYVDHVYMPVAIGPKNNPYIGYSGSVQPLSDFRTKLKTFLTNDVGSGWPVYNLDPKADANKYKLPGGYNIFAQRTGTLPMADKPYVPVAPTDGFPPVLTVLKCLEGNCSEADKKNLHFGQAVQRIQDLWGACVDWTDWGVRNVVNEKGDLVSQSKSKDDFVTKNANCAVSGDLKKNLGVVKQFFEENHKNYVALFATGVCNLDKDIKKPIPFNFETAIQHIYGWVPYNEGCGAAANPLSKTAISGWDHGKVQAMYIHELQYNYTKSNQPNSSLFNPYVKLIHAPEYLSMGAYGFSVDDAVGFMSELGEGLIFTVGGPKGLENQQSFNYKDGFSVAIGVPVNKANRSLIKSYGVCSIETGNDCTVKQNVPMPTNTQIAGFRVGNVASYPIKVAFTDMDDYVYEFVVNEKFAECPISSKTTACPTNKSQLVDQSRCVVKKGNEIHPKSKAWCVGADPNQQRDGQLTKNFLSFPDPVRCLLDPNSCK